MTRLQPIAEKCSISIPLGTFSGGIQMEHWPEMVKILYVKI